MGGQKENKERKKEKMTAMLLPPGLLPLEVFLFVVASSLGVRVVDWFVSAFTTLGAHHSKEKQLALQLRSLRTESNKYNQPKTFAKYAKLQRQIKKVSEQLNQLRAARHADPLVSVLPTLIHHIVKLGSVALLLFLYWEDALFVAPSPALLHPLLSWLAVPAWPAGVVGVVAWLALCHGALTYLQDTLCL
ncbi:hypothetical protein QOT17_011705 [Balamuthia mandrillaris]